MDRFHDSSYLGAYLDNFGSGTAYGGPQGKTITEKIVDLMGSDAIFTRDISRGTPIVVETAEITFQLIDGVNLNCSVSSIPFVDPSSCYDATVVASSVSYLSDEYYREKIDGVVCNIQSISALDGDMNVNARIFCHDVDDPVTLKLRFYILALYN